MIDDVDNSVFDRKPILVGFSNRETCFFELEHTCLAVFQTRKMRVLSKIELLRPSFSVSFVQLKKGRSLKLSWSSQKFLDLPDRVRSWFFQEFSSTELVPSQG